MNLQTRGLRSFRSGGDGSFIGSGHQQQPSSPLLQHALQQHQQQSQSSQQLSADERNQVIFRKVRGILNKLTPEKFDKLGAQLIDLGLDSVAVLKGVILLIFEKAIEEPKYSSMYAQLCKKLSRELSTLNENNTTTTALTGSSSSTSSSSSSSSAAAANESNAFCRLLLLKCRDEFDNRLKASEKFREKLTTGADFVPNSAVDNKITNNGNNNSANNNNNNHKAGSGQRAILTNLSTLSPATNRSGAGAGGSGNREFGTRNAAQAGGGGSGASASASHSLQVHHHRQLSEEEEEQRSIAKSKMLGNIRFICELGRQGLVQENILHVCIQQLVSKRNVESIASKSEDFECLCQIMKTVGRLLDTEKARKLMDQYFERIIFYSGCPELPSRIRFMLKDVIELREWKWQPRRVQRENGPRPIGQIREEAARDLGYNPVNFWDTANMLQGMTGAGRPAGAGFPMMMAQGAGAAPHYGQYNQQQQQQRPLYGHPSLPLVSNPGQRALDDMGYYANCIGSNSFLGTGPGTIRENDPRHASGGGGGGSMRRNQHPQQQQPQDGIGHQSQGNRQQQHLNQNNLTGGGSGGPGGHVQGHMPYRGSSSQDDPRKRTGRDDIARNSASNPRNPSQTGAAGVNLPPRMMQTTTATSQKGYPGPASLTQSNPSVNQLHSMSGPGNRILAAPIVPKMPPIECISLRPAQNSMVLKPMTAAANMTSHRIDMNAKPVSGSHSDVTTGILANGKAVTPAAAVPVLNPKEVLLKKAGEAVEQLVSQSASMKEVMGKMRDLKIQKNFQTDVLTDMMKNSLTRSDKDREIVMKFLTSMRSDHLLSSAVYMKSCETLLSDLSKLESDDPLIKTHLSDFIGSFVSSHILDLRQAYELVGDRYPMFLLVLQRMNHIVGKTVLSNLLQDSKINLMSILPEGDRNQEQLNDILEKRGLSFLQPLLKIELDLRRILKSNETNSPSFVYKWIKDNVEENLLSSKGFILLLFTCICRHIVSLSEQQQQQSSSEAGVKSQADIEKEGISSFRPILTAFIVNKASLQLTALYALQTICHEVSFPKGMILRWFNNLYEQEIIDEEIFLKWKEDLNDEFPGKGQALFQVNAWLIWLAETEADSEDDEEEDEEADADSLSRK